MRIDTTQFKQTIELGNGDLINVSPPVDIYSYNLLVSMGYKRISLYDYRLTIPQETIDESFEPLENFNFMDFVKKGKKLVSYYSTFKSKNLDYYITLDIDLTASDSYKSPEDEDEVFVKDSYKISYIYYRPSDENLSEVTKEVNSLCTVDGDFSSKVSLVMKNGSSFYFKNFKISPLEIDLDRMYNDDFKEVDEVIVNKLTNHNKGVVLLHGLAGTGKTNYIKHLTTRVSSKNFVFIPSNMIPFLSDPSFTSVLVNYPNSILVLEDCETYLRDRSTTNNGDSVISSILNISDGMLSDVLNIQIICTFNTEISNVDSALLRAGRLIAEYKFDKLSKTKCSNLLIENGVGDKVVQEILWQKGELTLAEVYHALDKAPKTVKKQGKIGF